MEAPDPRWLLANERTALAWIRTSLALLAGGVGLGSAVRVASLARGLDVLAALVCLLGVLSAAAAYAGWRRRDRAMRLGQPLPTDRYLALLTGSVVALGAGLAGYLVIAR